MRLEREVVTKSHPVYKVTEAEFCAAQKKCLWYILGRHFCSRAGLD